MADSSNSEARKLKTTIGLFVEFGGFAPTVISANADIYFNAYDDVTYSQLGLRIGFAITFYNYRTIPLLINGSLGKSHRFEYGAGVIINPFGIPLEYDRPAFNLSQTALKLGALIGWRFEERDGGGYYAEH